MGADEVWGSRIEFGASASGGGGCLGAVPVKEWTAEGLEYALGEGDERLRIGVDEHGVEGGVESLGEDRIQLVEASREVFAGAGPSVVGVENEGPQLFVEFGSGRDQLGARARIAQVVEQVRNEVSAIVEFDRRQSGRALQDISSPGLNAVGKW